MIASFLMSTSRNTAPLRAAFAGLSYFLMVFAAGFVLGVFRTLFLVPRFGGTGAVAIELPFILAISWGACGLVLDRLPVRTRAGRALMGAVAFLMLLGAEAVLSVLVLGLSAREFAASFAAPPGALGLAGQIAYGLMPLIRPKSPSSP